MRLRLVLPRRRGRAGLGGLSLRRLAGPATLSLLAAAALIGCGSTPSPTRGAAPPRRGAENVPRGPAFGITEDNAQLLEAPSSSPRSPAPSLEAARERLTALHPRYVRLLIDWAALQPDAGRAAQLSGEVDGCSRSISPCAAYAGVRAELAALAARQLAARAEGRGGYEVVLDVYGTPAWAARPPSGCEAAEAGAFSRPITPAGLAAYRALIGSLLSLGRSEGVALEWWAPWNEPNDATFLSPQHGSCAAGAPSSAPTVYAQLAHAMAGELSAAGGTHHLLLGELNAFTSDSPHRTSIQSFVAGLPAGVLCLSDVWSIHAYAARYRGAGGQDPVRTLASALSARGACGREARIWITEAGAGAPHPGRARAASAEDEHDGCVALDEQLDRWAADPRVQAVFQYSFREDPAFPVGLVSADLTHVYPAYRMWLRYVQASERGLPPPPAPAACA